MTPEDIKNLPTPETDERIAADWHMPRGWKERAEKHEISLEQRLAAAVMDTDRLMEQVAKSIFKDELGHQLVFNKAFCALRETLASIRSMKW